MEVTDPAGVLLYDGICGLCNGAVQTIIKHEKRGTLRFAPLQGNFSRRVKSRHHDLEHIDSIVFVEFPDSVKERVFVRFDAALRVASYLGGVWNLALIFRLIPKKIRDFLYDFIASRRYKIFGRYDTCTLPPANLRARFLE